ncbi:MAG: hypothetical protein ACLUJR_00435 [Mediterraneibacter gnavus]
MKTHWEQSQKHSKNRLPVFGCAPMARGNDLNGYLCAGVRLDHESYDHEEVVEKMRKGMHMLIRGVFRNTFPGREYQSSDRGKSGICKKSQLLYR